MDFLPIKVPGFVTELHPVCTLSPSMAPSFRKSVLNNPSEVMMEIFPFIKRRFANFVPAPRLT
jgi:hypothetical protein